MELFEKISEKYENKRIKRDCKALMKKCSAKSSRDMNTLVELIDLMYIYQDFEMAVELYHIIEKVEFTGNYTIYDEISYAKWTIVRIYRETNQTEKYEQLLNSVMEYENEAYFGLSRIVYTELLIVPSSCAISGIVIVASSRRASFSLSSFVRYRDWLLYQF